ncbi:hypothetical protein D0864_06192 [Hortaea werneckii]|uniref:Pyridoxamine 5'-phosphate oxidase N-terminal domain-containing protein n=1 Tax=Hortaea werneckii TaxID=91943 RepID=A0A3M7FPM5_HORWE|nr:hypothetical protein KC319_g1084 [Hortaea werneckii]KAI7722736.1 hypothetical protein KC322_g1438 [Hortaea werneckii]RMY90752.1 hypothetical protein D0864_06192 [Hortaea werneckii]
MTDAQPPLTWEGSASSNPIVSDTLPDEVITCLQNSRFLHLATALNNRPHVSLMNYTYLPTHPFTSHPTQLPLAGPLIIMTSNPASKKTLNLLQNHNVSLLVHDWVSSRPPHLTGERERSPTGGAGGGRASSLANMLMQMNSAAVSSISATMNGEAVVLEAGTEEEKWCREQHLLNNTFEAGGGGGGGGGEVSGSVGTGMGNGTDGPQAGGQGSVLSTSPSSQQPRSGDGGRSSYIEDQDVRVVVVRIRDGRISDWKGGVKDFVLSHAGEDGEGGRGMVNGVGH